MNQRGQNSDSNKWNESPAPAKSAVMAPPIAIPATPAPTRTQRTNDLEIIVTHKSLT
jgi:hypothetical protein